MTMNYSNELNTIIIVALLKKHNIKKIIVSPGTTNVAFVISVQNDPFFEVYSAVDERSASYMACGLADASGETVVLSCTGATASRNYLPGLTEAYYRHLPVIAITSSLNYFKKENCIPQYVDRTQQFRDLVKYSIQAPIISERERESYVTQINRAILETSHHVPGPVHINLEFSFSGSFIDCLPDVRKITRVEENDLFPEIDQTLKVAVFIGSHSLFTEKEQNMIDLFCKNNNAIAICDQTSNYRGQYRYLANLANQQDKVFSSRFFDLIIHIGSVSGAYIPLQTKQTWRVNKDGEVKDLFGNLTYVFQMREIDFFEYYSRQDPRVYSDSLIKTVQKERQSLLNRMGDLPFSNLWLAQQLAESIPEHSVLHLGILNSLRAWNIFETDSTIACYSNTGGFGIDGCLSSFLGAAKSNAKKQYYGIFGDLSFFYDINAIANDLPDNIHILLVNNGVGTEFKNYSHLAAAFGERTDSFIAAKGHNGNKSFDLIRKYAENCGLFYISAKNKKEFNFCKEQWLHTGKTILEVFTTDIEESEALKMVNSIEKSRKTEIKEIVRKILHI